jgi:hypothetical protein
MFARWTILSLAYSVECRAATADVATKVVKVLRTKLWVRMSRLLDFLRYKSIAGNQELQMTYYCS